MTCSALWLKLRSAKGYLWDREQTHLVSCAATPLEEAYELVDAIEAGDDPEMTEELGDLLLQVVFHAQWPGNASL